MENTQKSFIRQPGRKAEDSIRKMTIYKDSAVNAMKDSLEFDKKIVESNDEYIKKLREADATEYDILKANMEKAESEEERSAIRSRLAEMNAQRYKKDTENKEFYQAGKYDGKVEGYEEASDEYEEKLLKQADEFLKQKQIFESERDAYEALLDEYETEIDDLSEKLDRTEAENEYLQQLLLRDRKLRRMAG